MNLSFLLAASAIPGLTSGHGGGLNADGCHNNRKTGDYHCHRAPSPQTSSFVQRSAASGSVYYQNCAAARTAGAAPVKRGEPGYGPHLDRDNDGIGCE
jgi:hypothetical protein